MLLHRSISAARVASTASRRVFGVSQSSFQRPLALFSNTSKLSHNSCGSGSGSGSPPNPTAEIRNVPYEELDEMPPAQVAQYLQQTHDRVFENNRKWAEEQLKKDPEFFTRLSEGQNPEYLWIGCSDSRIPAEQITGLGAGEAFIHRNIANVVNSIDLNAMSVINYAVRHLHVKHIIVCGHYGCGGVKAAMSPKDLGILNPWLRNIRDVYRWYEKELDAIECDEERYDRLVECNVLEQCRNVIKTAAVQQSYEEHGYPIVHGWVFDFRTGLLKDLEINFERKLKDVQKIYNITK